MIFIIFLKKLRFEVREYSDKKIKELFLKKIWYNINYAKKLNKTEEEKLENLAFSILVDIDGCSSLFPNFILAPNPCEGDKEFLTNIEIDYFPENLDLEDKIKGNISGELHDDFFSYKDSNIQEIKDLSNDFLKKIKNRNL